MDRPHPPDHRLVQGPTGELESELRELPVGSPDRDPSESPVSRSLDAQELVAGRYRVEAFIARGGMGEVYRAEDLELGVPVALKTVRPGIASRPDVLRRFKQEVILARSVSHANVCRIFDIGRHTRGGSQITFLTMELLRGETLAARIDRLRLLEPFVVVAIARQVAEALDAAHHAGIVHRDLKSSNIFVEGSREERAVVTDFGLALSWQDQPRTDSGVLMDHDEAIVGTPEYMAPEQVRGERPGPAADRYAFGILLFEMVTGRLPFDGQTRVEIMRARLEQEPHKPSDFADVPSRWDGVVSRLLSPDPAQRFPTSLAAMTALEGSASQVRVPTGPSAHALPAERDPFVGRRDEIEILRSSLEPTPALVTLLGPGGVGKTRLARRYAWMHQSEWPGGAWFCDLADAKNLNDIIRSVATMLQIPLGRGDHVEQLAHALRSRGRALIILDNFEQVREHAGTTLALWAKAAAEASFLITSRERLGIAGERVHDLHALPVADAAVELFKERARAQRPQLAETEEDHRRIREIVAALDGMPLAIEMAAARLRVLSVQQLHDRLQDRLPWLTSTKPGRHQSMQAVYRASWEALEPWEQSAALQAAVFAGGFELEAAEEVIDVTAWKDAPIVLDLLQVLLDKSWLTVDSRNGDARFGTYAITREFLERIGNESVSIEADHAPLTIQSAIEQARDRHASFFATFAERYFINDGTGLSRPEADLRLRGERSNLLVACSRGIEMKNAPIARRALEGCWRILQNTGPFSEGVELGRQAEAIPESDPRNRAGILATLAAALWRSGRSDEAEPRFLEALEAFRQVGNRKGEAVVISYLGNLDRLHGRRSESLQKHEEALAIYKELESVNGGSDRELQHRHRPECKRAKRRCDSLSRTRGRHSSRDRR